MENNLFDHAGVELPATPAKPKRPQKLTPPSPVACAASGRLDGARRSRPLSRTPRDRVGPARDLNPGRVLAYPLSRNVTALAEVIERLPHGYDDSLPVKCDREAQNITRKLMRKGIAKLLARKCAKDLVDVAYTKRVSDAHKEAERS